MAGIDRDAVRKELESTWLEGLDGGERAEGAKLIGEVVDEWAREADSTQDPAAVLKIQQDELAARGRGKDGEGRLHELRARVVERKVDRLSANTLALGKAILEGSEDDEEGRAKGREYLQQAEQLAHELDRLGVAQDDPFRRDLGDAAMEALYAVERKAMSIRLARSAQDAGQQPKVY